MKTETNHLPLWVKLAYTGFVAVMVPYYWRTYGPTNFLYFCDVAVLLTLAAVWLENSLLISAAAVGILLPQAVWVADFFASLGGLRLTGMTAYMFNPHLSLFARGLSFFHFWLPFFLVWAMRRVGYDRRALVVWTGLAWALMLVSYFLLPAPPASSANPNLPVNVNYVYGLSDERAQTWMPAAGWFALLMAGLPLLVFLPTHLLLRRVYRPAVG